MRTPTEGVGTDGLESQTDGPDVHRLRRFRKMSQSLSGTPNLRASVESVDDTSAPASASICGDSELGGMWLTGAGWRSIMKVVRECGRHEGNMDKCVRSHDREFRYHEEADCGVPESAKGV
jgi:hypothetical protein